MADDEEIEYSLENEDGEEIEVDVEDGEGEGEEEDLEGDDADFTPENNYYEAKNMLEDNFDEAIELFETVLDLEERKEEGWGFKALKQMIKAFYRTKKYDEMVKRYKKLMEYIPSINRNDSERAINKILTMCSNVSDQQVLDKIYTMTLEALKTAKNDKLWFSVKTKQARLFFETQEYKRLLEIAEELKAQCINPDGTEDPRVLDIYVVEIQLYTEQNDSKRLKKLYEKCMKILGAGAVVSNPKTTGIIRECGGKMYMREKNWKPAFENFFEAFKSYDEAGNPRRIQCLKYLVLANMLSSSNIDPFDAQEVKPYKNQEEIKAMTDLVAAFLRADIASFEKILKQNKKTIADDSFIKEYISDLLKEIRTKVILQIIEPYTRIHVSFLAKELNVEADLVEFLCVDLILDQKLDGHIDQMKGLLELGGNKNAFARYKALSQWARRVNDIHHSVLNKVS